MWKNPDVISEDIDMSDTLSLQELTDRHKQLYDEVQKNRNNSSDNLIQKVDDLLKDIKTKVKEDKVRSVDEYRWICHAAHEWQTVFTMTFDKPRDIEEELELDDILISSLEPSTIPEESIKKYLDEKAFLVGESRQWEELVTLLRENLYSIHEKIPSTAEQQNIDWQNANIYLANEVLEGRFNFISLKDNKFYELLSTIWLDEVRQLKAYFLWHNQHSKKTDSRLENLLHLQAVQWDAEEAYSNYIKACERINNILLNNSFKTNEKRFKKVRNYLEHHYLSKGKLDIDKPDTYKLISDKAYRIWELSGKQLDQNTNWQLAEKYVRMFYDNIIPIVTEDQSKDKFKVMIHSLISQISDLRSVFQEHNLSNGLYQLINCFEAALAIYFIKRSILKDLSNHLF